MRQKRCSKQLGLQLGISQRCCPAAWLCLLPTLAIKPRPHEQPEQAAAPGSSPCPATVLPGSREMQTPRATASHPEPTAQCPSGHEGIFFLETLLQERSSDSPKMIPSCGHGSHKGLLLWLRHSPTAWVAPLYTQRNSHASPQRGQDSGAASTASLAHRMMHGVTQHQTLHSYLQILANASTIPARL